MILISAVGSGGTNRLLESIEGFKGRFIGITADKYRLFTSVLDKNFLVSHASDEERYINDVNEITVKWGVDLFIPNSDLEVYVVSKHREKIVADVFLPGFDVVDVCFDKWKLHVRMNELGIASARTFAVERESDIERAFESIHTRPLWCRVRRGSGSRYTSRVISVEDAKCYIKHCISVYNLSMSDFLLSEYLPGDDMAVMTIWKNGEMKMCKMGKRTRYVSWPGESPPTVIESFYDLEVERFVRDAILRLDSCPNGIFGVDMKRFSDGSPAITEINPGRFYYNMPLFNYGRINAFSLFLRLAGGGDTEFVWDDPGVVFLREQDNEPYVVKKALLGEYYNECGQI